MKAQIQNLGAFLVKLRMKLKGSEQTKQDEILTLLGRGGLNQPALFSDGYFSMKKGSGGPKFRDFS